MNTKELNDYIKNYVIDDKTNRAIMLTAEWGAGKSYYVKNELSPFLIDYNDIDCVVVSLYGLTELSELSKNIYIEARAKFLNAKIEKGNIGKIIAKSIAKNIAGHFGIDLSINKKDLQKLYSSINLSNKLLVLEDLERSSIDIVSIMGFVNNLCEQDGVKVLLVANEKEIIKHEDIKHKEETPIDKSIDAIAEKAKKEKPLTEKSKEYLKIKEKTVSDTIPFYCQTKQALQKIMESFDNKYFNKFLEEKDSNGESWITNEIETNVMNLKGISSHNLRAFIYACQKTAEIFRYVNNEYDVNFLKYLFLSIVIFSFRKSKNDNIKWEEQEGEFSNFLGTFTYPLPKFCYDYICKQFFDENKLKQANSLYIIQKDEEKKKLNVDVQLKTIFNFYYKKESEVISALNNIKIKLQNNDIQFSDYKTLANYLVAIRYALDCNDLYQECKKIMIDNLSLKKSDINEDLGYNYGIQLETQEQIDEFNSFIQEMTNISHKNKTTFNFDYKVDTLPEFKSFIQKNKDRFVNERVFAKELNNYNLVNMLENCSAKQIYEVRSIFNTVYSFSNIGDFFADDKESLIDLKQRIEMLLNQSTTIDKIQKLQLKWFISNLDNYISRL
ncbi:MAG: hypothetical protein IJQ07_06580 [Clostridia bacterium]|nr:hypothetical protein [Clostridia bacterium]